LVPAGGNPKGVSVFAAAGQGAQPAGPCHHFKSSSRAVRSKEALRAHAIQHVRSANTGKAIYLDLCLTAPSLEHSVSHSNQHELGVGLQSCRSTQMRMLEVILLTHLSPSRPTSPDAPLTCSLALWPFAGTLCRTEAGGPHGTAGSMLMECGLQKHSDVDARGRSATCAWLELPNFLRSLRATCRCSTAWLRVQLSVKWSPDGQSQFMPGECSPPIITRTRSCPL
jgi:hypothetical protein